ncbi:MAG: NAD(P)-dependent glycerol-3-phosphate dehydrogenase [Candidatus Stahlbacteria bacterium]|nr:NAD(P)-dependent glycerol-3-phosphate dehydrogenase [Candidatus Stahlbacteria bacterium]
MKVTILGAGNWGTTLAILLAKKASVTLWTIEKIDGRENKKYLPGYEIPANILITESLPVAIEGAGLIIFAIPSQVMREVAKQISAYGHKTAILLSVSKGIENKTLKIMSELLEEEIKCSYSHICALSGPTIAREVIRGLPTSCVAASSNEGTAKIVQKLFNSTRFRVYTSTDIIGVELGGAIKNVISLASGICDGLGLGANAKGSLLTRGIREITRLGVAMGANASTFAGLSGIGDLITTSFSEHSRNRWVGEQIGKGKSLKEVLSQMVEVAEGVSTTLSVIELSGRFSVPMPITQEVYEILYNGKTPLSGMQDLMTREPKSEHI